MFRKYPEKITKGSISGAAIPTAASALGAAIDINSPKPRAACADKMFIKMMKI